MKAFVLFVGISLLLLPAYGILTAHKEQTHKLAQALLDLSANDNRFQEDIRILDARADDHALRVRRLEIINGLGGSK
jgi:hypothetical protein